ncbi:MAG: hypothetical protein KAH08_02045 [Methylococcales bacterium]|nr:hypothetical protein [Methylococcales bacterium]
MKTTQILLAAGISLLSTSAFALGVDITDTNMVVNAVHVENIAKGYESQADQNIGTISGNVSAVNTDMTVNATDVTNLSQGIRSEATQNIGTIYGGDDMCGYYGHYC